MDVTHHPRFLGDCQPGASLICFNDSALIDGRINLISSEISKEVRLESINCRARLGRELRAARGDALGRHTPTCSKKVL